MLSILLIKDARPAQVVEQQKDLNPLNVVIVLDEEK